MFNYNEMFKINENCEVKIEKIENHTVLTIDNYYKYPNKIYDFIEKSKKFKDPNNYYPGVRKNVYNCKEHLNELTNLLIKLYFQNLNHHSILKWLILILILIQTAMIIKNY